MSKVYLIAVYEVNREFGGPEEGGWWYDAGELVRVVKCFRNYANAYTYAYRLNSKLWSRKFGPNYGKHKLSSVLSEGEIQAHIVENFAPRYFPEERPRYC